jgi:hypothetical protein
LVRGHDALEERNNYRGAYDIARHYEQEVLPLRQIIAVPPTSA